MYYLKQPLNILYGVISKKQIIIIKNLKNFSSNQKEVKKNIETEPEETINSNELADLSHNIFIMPQVYLGEGSGIPLQYSCLENPMDGGAWWAAVHGVARVGHDYATSLSLFTFMHWRRK